MDSSDHVCQIDPLLPHSDDSLQKGEPNLKPIAMCIVSSSILRPKDETGRALNQAPDSLEVAAKGRALDLVLEALSNKASDVAITQQRFQDFANERLGW